MKRKYPSQSHNLSSLVVVLLLLLAVLLLLLELAVEDCVVVRLRYEGICNLGSGIVKYSDFLDMSINCGISCLAIGIKAKYLVGVLW